MNIPDVKKKHHLLSTSFIQFSNNFIIGSHAVTKLSNHKTDEIILLLSKKWEVFLFFVVGGGLFLFFGGGGVILNSINTCNCPSVALNKPPKLFNGSRDFNPITLMTESRSSTLKSLSKFAIVFLPSVQESDPRCHVGGFLS